MSRHRAYQLYAHITWHTWNRVGCLDLPATVDVRGVLESACRRTGVRVLRHSVLADHVHVVVSFRPDTRLSDLDLIPQASRRHPNQADPVTDPG